jgi:hypothetical protein
MIRPIKNIAFVLVLLLGSSFFVQCLFAQSYELNNDTSFLEVHGTSSLHDWHVDAQKQMGAAEISSLPEMNIDALSFSVVSESLKSGKSGMDKNTYKALKTDSYKTIDFELTKVEEIQKTGENLFKVSAQGKMTITGVTKTVPIVFTIKSQEGVLLVDGEKTMKMTDFGIDPPTALFGTIKTGDEIKVIFKAVYNLISK